MSTTSYVAAVRPVATNARSIARLMPAARSLGTVLRTASKGKVTPQMTDQGLLLILSTNRDIDEPERLRLDAAVRTSVERKFGAEFVVEGYTLDNAPTK